jgi:hypothetical protein
MSENYEMAVFDAMAFALAFFYFQNRKKLFGERKSLHAFATRNLSESDVQLNP